MNPVPLARRAARLAPKIAATGQRDIIAFDSGHGFAGIFPDLTAAAESALTKYRAETLQYGERLGLPELRAWIAGYLKDDGAGVAADEILITNGAKHGIELICRLLLDEGDSIIVTAPTYFTAIPIFRSFEAEFIEIGQDDEGLDTDALASALARMQQDGRKTPKFIYALPDFHNPTGVTMSGARRRALLDIAAEHGVYVIEDSPYRSVRFEGEPLPSLKALDQTQSVIQAGTFSKLIAPGVRLGWVAGACDLVARMAQLKSDGGSSPLLQRIIVEWLKAGHLPAHTRKVRDTFRVHRDRIVSMLKREMADVAVAVPEGGYYVWITLPDAIDGDEFARRAAGVGVNVVSGSKFFAGAGTGYPRTAGVPKNHVRLAYSHTSPEEIDDGIHRLAGILHSMRR